MALTVAAASQTTYGGIIDGAFVDRLSYDADDAAGSPTITPPGLAFKAFTVTFDSSYATGGESFTASDCELASITHVLTTPLVKSDHTDAYVCQWDGANNKLMAFRDTSTNTTLTQVPNTTDLSAYSTRVLVFGHRVG